MRQHPSPLFAPRGKPSSSRPRTPVRRARLSVEQCEPRLLLTTGIFQPPPLEGIFVPPDPPGHFASLTAFDASGDDSLTTVFKNGALRVNYNVVIGAAINNTNFLAPAQNQNPLPPPPPPPPLDHVTVEAWQGSTKIADLGTFTKMTVTGGLVNLANAPLTGGTYVIKATAFFKNGSAATTMQFNALQVKTGEVKNGTVSGDTFLAGSLQGNGVVVHGNGGTDTLDLQVERDLVASLNGKPLSAYTPTAGGQAIYHGLAVDYVRLTDGREFYFTGIENLTVLEDPVLAPPTAGFIVGPQIPKFTQTIPLTVRPNDPDYDEQWNLHTTDVPDAWRFTTGSEKVLLVSLDDGVFLRTFDGDGTLTHGLPTERLIFGANDDDETALRPDVPFGVTVGHGHQAISVMVATPNDGQFHTGINWVSTVFVKDVYGGEINLQDAIKSALGFARAQGLKVVFQGGIQGERWLNDRGDTQAELEGLFRDNADISVYAIAAGNGGIDLDVTDPANPSVISLESGGVARLAASHGNVMAVGALEHTRTFIDGLENADTVNLASYSNFGRSLTMVAPTDSPATSFRSDRDGTRIFDGTSCANPNLAAMASLVWSVNTNLSGVQVRQILEQTALDLEAAGRDNTFGSGLVDAGEAVRRAVALARDPALANLAFKPSAFVAAVGAPLNVPLSAADEFPLLEADVPPPKEVAPIVAPTPPRPALLARVVKLKGQSQVQVFDAATGALRRTLKPFGKFSGKVQVALIDVNGDGTKDLVVTARVNGKLRKKVYNGLDLAPLPA